MQDALGLLAATFGIYYPEENALDSEEQKKVTLERIKSIVDQKLSESEDKHVTFQLSVDVAQFDPNDKSMVVEEVAPDKLHEENQRSETAKSEDSEYSYSEYSYSGTSSGETMTVDNYLKY